MSKRISEDLIENIRKTNDIVDVIGEYVQLKKQGRNYFGLCPFHGEKTPSFSVTREKQIFHCFGCKKGGNVMNFLMEKEGISFQESLEILADRSGIELPNLRENEETSLSKENKDMLSAYEWLMKLYHHLLQYTKDGATGHEYFKQRGINEETIDSFQLGFAPNIKDFVGKFLEKKGFHRQILIKAGILRLEEDDHVTDRFRGRVIFPIRNHLGKTVGFGGRSINEEQPKYLNSSESELFKKSKLLYNFDQAKRSIRKSSEVILLEGQMDVLSAYQAGISNVVATLGTALTESQAKLLKRYADTVIICYDPDHAGIEASYRAAILLRKIGCGVKIARLEEGIDPDQYIKKYGGDRFKQDIIDTSDTYLHFFMRYIQKDYNLSIEADRIQYIKKVLKQIAMIESTVEREYYLQDLSNTYQLSMQTLKDEVNTLSRERQFHQDKSWQNRYTSKTVHDFSKKRLMPAFQNAERHLIAYMLHDASIANEVRNSLGVDFNLDDHKIIVTHLYAFYEEAHKEDVSLFIENLTDEHLKQLVIEIAMTPILDDISDQEIKDYIRIIKRQTNEVPSLHKYREEQKLAEQQNDPIKAAQIAMQIIEIQKQLK